jgi:hypothetical protein
LALNINIELEFGKLVLFNQSVLDETEIDSKTNYEQRLIFNNNELRVITKNNSLVYKDFELNSFEGIKVTYEKPAKGGGIISINFRKNTNEFVGGFYIYLNIKRNQIEGWDYQLWDEKKEWFDNEIVSYILSLTTKQLLEKCEYSNC